MNNLASTLLQENRYAEADKLYAEVLQAKRRVLGPEHPDTLLSMGNLASALRGEQRYAEAEKLLLEGWRGALGDKHPDTASTAYDLACVLALEGRQDGAFANLRFAVEHELPAQARQGLEKDPDLKSLHADPAL
jgi:hypothetical protein